MAEFWRRWHISLITWLTDYVYTPLSFHFRKHKVRGVIIALLLTFMISGIWHGAALTFVVWGLMQGIFLSIEALTQKRRSVWEEKYHLQKNGFYLAACMLFTFILFSASQIFGRAENMEMAITIYKKIIFQQGQIFLDFTTLLLGLLGLLFVMMKDIRDEFFIDKFLISSINNQFLRYGIYTAIFYLIILTGCFDKNTSFIYFKF